MDSKVTARLLDLQDEIDRQSGYLRALSILITGDAGSEAFDIFLIDIRGRLSRISRKMRTLRQEVAASEAESTRVTGVGK